MKKQIFFEKNITSRKLIGLKNQNEENKLFKSKKLLIPGNSKMKDSQIKFIIKKECKTKNTVYFISNEGRWSKEEHDKFLEGIALYGINWKKIKTLIRTRTSMQVRSHAQKFYQKMKACKDEILGIDFTLNSVCNIRDMINQIKNNNINCNIINIFKYLANKCDNHEKPRKYNNISLKKSELINQSNIINLKEDNLNINDNNSMFNHNNNINININKIKKMKETKNINDNELNYIIKMTNQNNIVNILQDLLIMNHNSILFNLLYPNNLYLSNYDITTSVNKLLINYLISNSELNISNIINENTLILLALRNNILNNFININFIHNINNISLEDINCNNNNYNNISNINNVDNIDKVKDNVENSLFINIAKEYNIDLRHNNNNDCNIDDKNDNININKKDVFYLNKQLNQINDKRKNNNDENSNNNNNIFN